MVTRLDRLARSTRDLLNVPEEVAKRRRLQIVEGHVGGHYHPHGRLMLTILGAWRRLYRS